MAVNYMMCCGNLYLLSLSKVQRSKAWLLDQLEWFRSCHRHWCFLGERIDKEHWRKHQLSSKLMFLILSLKRFRVWKFDTLRICNIMRLIQVFEISFIVLKRQCIHFRAGFSNGCFYIHKGIHNIRISSFQLIQDIIPTSLPMA